MCGLCFQQFLLYGKIGCSSFLTMTFWFRDMHKNQNFHPKLVSRISDLVAWKGKDFTSQEYTNFVINRPKFQIFFDNQIMFSYRKAKADLTIFGRFLTREAIVQAAPARRAAFTLHCTLVVRHSNQAWPKLDLVVFTQNVRPSGRMAL